jgi:signal transduction histidine kinase
MRERALLIGGDLTIETAGGGGAEVRLRIPGEGLL